MKKLIEMLLGNIVLSFAASLMRYIGMGTDPLVTAAMGINNLLPINFGTTLLLLNGVFVLFVFLGDRKLINIGTLVSMSLIGYLQDFFYPFFTFETSHFFIQLMISILSVVIYCFGIALIIDADKGISPYEGFVLIVADKINGTFSKTKVSIDISGVIIGYLLGAAIGITTLITAFGTGSIISFFVNQLKNLQKEIKLLN